MDTIKEKAERERFEAHFGALGHDIVRGVNTYRDRSTRTLWVGWRAASLAHRTASAEAQGEAVALQQVGWRYRLLVNKHQTGAPREGEVQIDGWWGVMSGWTLDADPSAYSHRPGFEREPVYVSASPASASTASRVAQEPVYWQWRRKDESWSLDMTFDYEVAVTSEDSEKRPLYTSPQPAQELKS